MKVNDEWKPHGAEYKRMHVHDKGDRELRSALEYHIHMVNNGDDRMQPQYRQWRRLLIREALKRGLIDADPGGAP